MAIDSVRETALKILYDINEKDAYSNLAINKYLEASDFKGVDRSFITDIVYGTIKWRLTIDWIIQQFSNIKLKKVSPWVLNILRMGVYQLNYTDKVPVSAACNESVKLAKRYGHSASSGYVNAVLRNVAKTLSTDTKGISFPDYESEPVKYMALKYSHPEWMVKRWVDRYGLAFTEELLKSNNEIPEFTIRVNKCKITKADLINLLKNDGIEAVDGKYAEEAITLKNTLPIAKLEAFKNGYFQVQDESSMLVAKILDPKPGETVMDVCSAPGGKSTHIAELMGNSGTVLARDIHEHKIELIKNAAERLGLDIINAEKYDATVLDNRYIEKVDRVLVDAPCTGYGIIRRKPDIKWNMSNEDSKEIREIQRKIINTASKYLKPGGTMVYSTCTLEPEENEKQIIEFFDNNKEFYPVNISKDLPAGILKDSSEKGYIQMYPNIDGIDGFFIAKTMKRG